MTLTEFLLARIAEDEGLARMAFADHNDNGPDWTEPWSGAVNLGGGEDLLITHDSGVSRHIVNWSPVRVLAECEVRRRIIVEHSHYEVSQTCNAKVLPILALAYASHPDYRQEWKP